MTRSVAGRPSTRRPRARTRTPGSRWPREADSSPAARHPTSAYTGAATVRAWIRTTRTASQAIVPGIGACDDDVRPADPGDLRRAVTLAPNDDAA